MRFFRLAMQVLIMAGIVRGQTVDNFFRSLGSDGYAEKKIPDSVLRSSFSFDCHDRDRAGTERQLNEAIASAEKGKTFLELIVLLAGAGEEAKNDPGLVPVWLGRIKGGAEWNLWLLRLQELRLSLSSHNAFRVCSDRAGIVLVRPANGAVYSLPECEPFPDPGRFPGGTPWISGRVVGQNWIRSWVPSAGAVIDLIPQKGGQDSYGFGRTIVQAAANVEQLCLTGKDGTFRLGGLDGLWGFAGFGPTDYILRVTKNGATLERPVHLQDRRSTLRLPDFQFAK